MLWMQLSRYQSDLLIMYTMRDIWILFNSIAIVYLFMTGKSMIDCRTGSLSVSSGIIPHIWDVRNVFEQSPVSHALQIDFDDNVTPRLESNQGFEQMVGRRVNS